MNAPTLTARPVFSFGALRLLGLPLAFAALIFVCLLPEQAGLSAAGHRMLGVMLFAVILWVTNAVSYPRDRLPYYGFNSASARPHSCRIRRSYGHCRRA